MTNHTPQQSKRNGYNPLTLEDVQPDPFFRNLDTPAGRIVGAALFLFIFSMSGNAAVAAPLVTLVFLACLLFRMTTRERALTAAPLTFSAVRLATQLAGPMGVWQYSLPRATAALNTQWSTGNVWVPLFLATYLFFTSSIATNTGRLVFWYSLGVLLSGLIPGEGLRRGLRDPLLHALFRGSCCDRFGATVNSTSYPHTHDHAVSRLAFVACHSIPADFCN